MISNTVTYIQEYERAKREARQLIDQVDREFMEASARGADKDELDAIIFRYSYLKESFHQDFPV